jgi:hypothetical protein
MNEMLRQYAKLWMEINQTNTIVLVMTFLQIVSKYSLQEVSW